MYTCMQLSIVVGSDGSVGYAPRIGFRTQHQKLPPPPSPFHFFPSISQHLPSHALEGR